MAFLHDDYATAAEDFGCPLKGKFVVNDSPYTVPEAAAKLGVTEQRVRQMCKEGVLKDAFKKDERWMIPGWSVRERFSVKPPKPKPDHEMALDYASWTIRELAGDNARLKRTLSRALESKRSVLQKLQNVEQILVSYERDLQMEVARSERLSQSLDKKEAIIAKLKKQIETVEQDSMMGARRPRIRGEPDTDSEPQDRRRRK